MEQLSFKLPVFEGPLELLLHLVRKNKVDIYDIPIAEITGQYLSYVRSMEELDLEVTADFLVMAATLLSIKSRMLLPREENSEDAEDPRMELVLKLVELQRYQETAAYLEGRLQEGQRLHVKPPESILDAWRDRYELSGDTEGLAEAFLELLRRVDEKKPPKREDFAPILSRRVYSVPEQRTRIAVQVKQAGRIAFLSLFHADMERGEMVAAFLAVLELIKENALRLRHTGRGKYTLYAGEGLDVSAAGRSASGTEESLG